MKKLLMAFLALGLLFGFSIAQDDAKQDHSEHSEEQKHGGEMDHGDHKENKQEDEQSEMDHGDMNHGDHDEISKIGESLNIVLVGESSLTLEPLVSADGTLTLGIKVEPPTDLILTATSPSGEEMMLDAVPVIAMDMKEDHEEGHGEDHSGEHSEAKEEEEHGDAHSEEHGDEDHDGEEAEGDHDMESMKANVASTLTFQLGAVKEGVWRFSGTLDGEAVSFPMSIYKASAGTTDVYLALAPSPALSTRGLSEAFVYAFRDGEVVHSGVVLNRSMEGMQHSTDDEQLMLTHNHFNDVYNDTLGYGPMANQKPLGFAMAGTWNVDVMIMGEPEERLRFKVEILSE